MQDRGNNVSRMYHAKRKWAKVKSCGGYQLLPLQSANNAVISIKRMQTHLVVDCCQEQVDVLSRNVTTSPRLAPTRTPEGECPRNPYGKWKTCPEGVRLQLGSVSGLRPRYSPPRVDLTHALLSLSYHSFTNLADDEIELKIKRGLIWITWVISREFRSCRVGSMRAHRDTKAMTDWA